MDQFGGGVQLLHRLQLRALLGKAAADSTRPLMGLLPSPSSRYFRRLWGGIADSSGGGIQLFMTTFRGVQQLFIGGTSSPRRFGTSLDWPPGHKEDTT